MFKNNLPISTLLGILIISIGAFILSIQLETIAQKAEYGGSTNTDDIIILSISIASILIGIGFILKLNWVRHLMALILTGFLFLLAYFYISNSSSISRRVILSNVAGVIVVGTIYFCFTFLLYNRKMSEEFGVRELEINNIPDLAKLFLEDKFLKKSVHSIATDLFFWEFRFKKNKSKWVYYNFPIPLSIKKMASMRSLIFKNETLFSNSSPA